MTNTSTSNSFGATVAALSNAVAGKKPRKTLSPAEKKVADLKATSDSFRAESNKLQKSYNALTAMISSCAGAYVTDIVSVNFGFNTDYVGTPYTARGGSSTKYLIDNYILKPDPTSKGAVVIGNSMIAMSNKSNYNYGINPDVNGALVYFFKQNLIDARDKVAALKTAADGNARNYSELSIRGTSGGKNLTSSNSPTNVAKPDLNNQLTVYNVSPVTQAYFTPRSYTEDQANASVSSDSFIVNGVSVRNFTTVGANDHVGLNTPSAVQDALQLWTDASKGSKGMIQTYFSPDGFVDSSGAASSAFPVKAEVNKYGFQFHYNPTSIQMQYMGVQQTDVAFQMAGLDKTNYIPAAGNSGAITFTILLNRMYDLPFYNSDGTLKESAKAANVYLNRTPYDALEGQAVGLFDEQASIYNKGTMYDIEYLLRTLLGFTLKSGLRNEMTADMGIFSRRQVELHLGPKMRYRGYVNGLSVNHTIFNERMVPLLSSVEITFNRYPDYPYSKGIAADKSTFKAGQ